MFCCVNSTVSSQLTLSHLIPSKQLFTGVFCFPSFCISHSIRIKVEFPPTGILEPRSYEKNAVEPIIGPGDQPSDQ